MRIEKIDLDITIEEIARKLRYRSDMVFLDSCSGYPDKVGRFSFLSYEPRIKIKSKNNVTTLYEMDKVTINSDDPLDLIDFYISKYGGESVPEKYKHIPFLTGFMGFISYDYKNYIDKFNDTTLDDLEMWDVYMMYYDKAIIYDSKMEELYLVARDIFSDSKVIINSIKKLIEGDNYRKSSFDISCKNFQSDFTEKVYKERLSDVKEYIKDGYVYQINMSQRFSVDFRGDPYNYYEKLRKINPSPFSAYISGEDFYIASSSLERFIKVSQGLIETRPIKGTVPRSIDNKEDLNNRRILENSMKDKSELLMIVDLERNDLSKVCEYGTVNVPELFSIEKYPTVYHLVSSVEGRLRSKVGIRELFHNTFPGGSITGAPKISAMNIIDRLEIHRRGLYTGSIGYVDTRGNLDFNIVIRTGIFKNGKLSINVGGGIVWDSDEDKEFQETLDKAKALFMAGR